MDEGSLKEIVANLRLVGSDTQAVEVKGNVGKSIRETLSAFANAGGGLIIVGLDEDAGFVPVDKFDALKAQDALETRCRQVTPPVRPQISVLPFEGGRIVAAELEEFSPFDKPCYVTDQGRYGGSYIRTGEGDTKLSNYEIDKLL